MRLAATAASNLLASHVHHAGDNPWIGLISITVLSLVLLVVLLVVINRPFAERRYVPEWREEDAELDAIPPEIDADGWPAWWSQFEREFAAYVAAQKSTRLGRRGGERADQVDDG